MQHLTALVLDHWRGPKQAEEAISVNSSSGAGLKHGGGGGGSLVVEQFRILNCYGLGSVPGLITDPTSHHDQCLSSYHKVRSNWDP